MFRRDRETDGKVFPSRCCEKREPCDYKDVKNSIKHSVAYQISHGRDVEKVVVSTGKDHVRVRDLLCEIEKVYNIPMQEQSLIYRGIKLHECPDQKLDENTIFPMSVLKLAGRRHDYKASLI